MADRHLTDRLAVIVLTLLLVAGRPLPARAQTDTATIRGVVTDPTDAVVPGAVVHLIDIARAFRVSATTGNAGRYTFTAVHPGRYEIRVDKTGFKPVRLAGIDVNVLDRLEHNVQLEIGGVVAAVQVDADPIAGDTENGAVSAVIDRQFIDNLPLNGRSVQTLFMMVPGVVTARTTFDDQGQFSVNGQRTNANYFTIDGVSANFGVTGYFPLVQSAGGSLPALSVSGGTNSLVSVDAMQEFRVQTSSFAPEFGRTPGGQISIVTRGGTNRFHGSAFEYFRTARLDASDWFGNANRLPKPDARQHDVGGVLGGPLRRDSAFFFASYERLRLRLPATRLSLVPDLLARQLAPSDMRPFLDAFPLPNGPSAGNGLAPFNASYVDPSTLDAFSTRLDHNVSAGLRWFGRYNTSPSRLEQRGAPYTTPALSTIQSVAASVHTVTAGISQLFGSAVSHDVRVNYSRHRVATTFGMDGFGGAVPLDDRLLFPPGYSSADSAFLLLVSGVGQYGTGKGGTDRQHQINVTDNVSWMAGNHQLKAGLDVRWLAPSSSPFAYRQFVQFTGVTSTPGGALSGTAAFVQPGAYQANELRSWNVSLYAQDAWVPLPGLTVTYGLRWDVNPPISGVDSANAPVTVEGLDDPATMMLAPRGTRLYATTYGNLAPRVGVAYQRGGAVVRAGFGTFYDLGYGSLGGTSAFYPYSADRSFVLVPFPLRAENAVPPPLTGALPASLIVVADPHLKLPRTYQWNAAVERSLGSAQTLSVTYVGAAGRDLLRVTNLLDPNPRFQVVSVTDNSAVSDYQGLQVALNRRLSRGLQGFGSYTWSHSVDTASTDAIGAYHNTPRSMADPALDRADSDFDIRHAFSAGVTATLPVLESHRILRAMLGGWSLSAFMFARSAPPVNVVGATTFAAGTILRYRPNRNPDVPLELTGLHYPGGKALNREAFSPAPPGRQGDFGRNVLRGFGAHQIDLAVQRRVQLTAGAGLRVRIELFNVLNQPNFGLPIGDLANPLFGRAAQMLGRSLGSGGPSGGFNPLYQVGGPRSIQLGLRLEF